MDKKFIEREKTFNKKEYDKEYRKKNYKQFNTNISIQLVDESGKEIYKFYGIIEETKAGETANINCSITADFADAYDFKIVKK